MAYDPEVTRVYREQIKRLLAELHEANTEIEQAWAHVHESSPGISRTMTLVDAQRLAFVPVWESNEIKDNLESLKEYLEDREKYKEPLDADTIRRYLGL